MIPLLTDERKNGILYTLNKILTKKDNGSKDKIKIKFHEDKVQVDLTLDGFLIKSFKAYDWDGIQLIVGFYWLDIAHS